MCVPPQQGLWGPGREPCSRELLRSSFFANRKRRKPKDRAPPSSSDDDLDAASPRKELPEGRQQQDSCSPHSHTQEEEEEEEEGEDTDETVEREGNGSEEPLDAPPRKESVSLSSSLLSQPSPPPPAEPVAPPLQSGSPDLGYRLPAPPPSCPSDPPSTWEDAVSDLGTMNSTSSQASAPRGRRRSATAPCPEAGAEVCSITSDYSTTSSTAFLTPAELGAPGPEERSAGGGRGGDDADDERSEPVSEGRAVETDSESDLSVFTVAGSDGREPPHGPRPLPSHRLIEGDTLSRRRAQHDPEQAEPPWRPTVSDRLTVRLRASADDMLGVGRGRSKNVRRRHTMGGQRDFAELSVLGEWPVGVASGSRSQLSAVDRLKPKCGSQDFSIGEWIARERLRTSSPEVSLDLCQQQAGPRGTGLQNPGAEASNGDVPPSKRLSLSATAHPHKLASSQVVHSRFYQYL